MSQPPKRILSSIEPELLAPTPRNVRRRVPFSQQSEAVASVLLLIDRLQPYLYLIFLIPVFWGLYFLYNLIRVALEVARGERRLVDILPLLVITCIWNLIVLSGLWNGVAISLLRRWLVIYGQPTVGRVTAFSQDRQSCRISYSFYDAESLPQTGQATLTAELSAEIRKANSELTILYFQQKPKWNVPYCCSGYQALR